MAGDTELTKAAEVAVRGADLPPGAPARRAELSLRQRRQIVLITLGAVAAFAGLRWLPTGTNLSHMDFRVDAKNPIEFCDPLNPQFIPVVAVPSPVGMTVKASDARAGDTVAAQVTLRTAAGKPIAPEDLLVVHTERLHLLIADPSLVDYQHVHPTPGKRAGEWAFSFTPRRSGAYRVFADFTPAATSRGLYASADLDVQPAARGETSPALGSEGRATEGNARTPDLAEPVERNGFRFSLTPGARPLRARTPIDLRFAIEPVVGGAVPLQPVMGAFAHLVAFDEARSGFAHLHPAQLDLAQPPDRAHPVLDFKITIPRAGRYVIWAQVNLAGREEFVPFWFEVTG